MRGFVVPTCATLVTLMVITQLLVQAKMQASVRDASSKIDTQLRPILSGRDVDDPEWQRASEVSREVMWINKAVYNWSSQLLYAQLVLGIAAVGVLLVHRRKERYQADPDIPRMQPDADGGDEVE